MLTLWFLIRNKPACRKELLRIYELRDLLSNPLPPGAYFRDLDKTLAERPAEEKAIPGHRKRATGS